MSGVFQTLNGSGEGGRTLYAHVDWLVVQRRRIATATYYNKLDKGSHFAAWEQPKLFCAEMRAAFRSLRQSI